MNIAKRLIAIIGWAILISVIYNFVSDLPSTEVSEEAKAERAAQMVETMEKTAAAKSCEDQLVSILKNSSSYEELSTLVVKRADGDYQVTIQYAAQNGFGATIEDTHSCTVSF